MSEIFLPKVKDCSVFREIALNTVNQLELLREAISNADDANANITVLCYFSLKRGAGCASNGDQQPRTPVDSTRAARPLSNKWQLYGVEWNYW